ncbi:MAG: hypothetical protein H6767_05305 [Candidatus Peribacteria bacterium]|nr:MAG: hypothetical protein H6767_05305 [Candidatus Peribacteria bacterium]
MNGTTLHVAPMDAYVDRQVQENSYKLLGQYATIIDDSVAIGALQVLL